MYKSPITLVQKQMAGELAEQLDGMIFKAVHEVVPFVDKDELLRALHYDRDQYDRGFNDGILAAAEELVRCKDCKYAFVNEHHPNKPLICGRTKMCGTTYPDWFCADGARQEEEE